MYKEALRPVWAEINLSNFDYNVKQIRAKIGPDREFIGVIKADAYGHGAIQCAQVLRENGVKTFAIATLQEAITLREAGGNQRRRCRCRCHRGLPHRRRYRHGPHRLPGG